MSSKKRTSDYLEANPEHRRRRLHPVSHSQEEFGEFGDASFQGEVRRDTAMKQQASTNPSASEHHLENITELGESERIKPQTEDDTPHIPRRKRLSDAQKLIVRLLGALPASLSNAQIPIVVEEIKKELPDSFITIWMSEERRKKAGNRAPTGRNIDVYLRKNPSHEIYIRQDKDEEYLSVNPGDNQKMTANRRVSLWDKEKKMRLTGASCPINMNLDSYLAKHDKYEVYNGQDKAPLPSSRHGDVFSPLGPRDTDLLSMNPQKEDPDAYGISPDLLKHEALSSLAESFRIPPFRVLKEGKDCTHLQSTDARNHPALHQSSNIGHLLRPLPLTNGTGDDEHYDSASNSDHGRMFHTPQSLAVGIPDPSFQRPAPSEYTELSFLDPSSQMPQIAPKDETFKLTVCPNRGRNGFEDLQDIKGFDDFQDWARFWAESATDKSLISCLHK